MLCADVDNLRFTAASVQKAKDDYKNLYYGLQNLAPAKKKAMEAAIFNAWECLKKARGIKHESNSSDPRKKKAKVA